MKLSIITVNLNNRSGLEKTILSVVNQSYSDYELIVIDGGSTDGSADLISQYKSEISYWISEKDKGIYNAMNKGIAVARGEYCYFLNSGDYFTGNSVLEELFKLDIHADIVSGNVLKIRSNGKYRSIEPHDKPTLHKLCIHSLPHQASLINRALFAEIGNYNESYRIVSDFDFFLRAIVVHKKTYQKVDLNFSYFNLLGISSNMDNFGAAKEESYLCLKNNFPDMVDDLMDYRYFYVSNIGQFIRMIQKKEKLYSFLNRVVGKLFALKKFIIGK